MRKANGDYAVTPQMDLQFTRWKEARKFIIPSECFFVWMDTLPNAETMGFHVLLRVMEEEGIGWYYEQGYLTEEGYYYRLGTTHFVT